jgi:hypothetical protein
MEIKTSQSIPLWLSRLLSLYQIYPSSFSKYGKEYENYLISKESKKVYIFVPKVLARDASFSETPAASNY